MSWFFGRAKTGPLLFAVLVTGLSAGVVAADRSSLTSMDGEIQAVKEKVLDVNRDLMLLEEDLLFPIDQQVQVFVSVNLQRQFDLDSVQVELDHGRVVSRYDYADQEIDALRRGGIHRILSGVVDKGKHQLTIVMKGSASGKQFQRGTVFSFDKTDGPKYVELQIKDDAAQSRPILEFSEY